MWFINHYSQHTRNLKYSAYWIDHISKRFFVFNLSYTHLRNLVILQTRNLLSWEENTEGYTLKLKVYYILMGFLNLDFSFIFHILCYSSFLRFIIHNSWDFNFNKQLRGGWVCLVLHKLSLRLLFHCHWLSLSFNLSLPFLHSEH